MTFNQTTGDTKLFVNGSQVGTTHSFPGIVPKTGTQLQIGQRTSTCTDVAAGSRFSGLIDEVEIFNRALSLTELQSIYNAGSLGKCKLF